MGVSDTGKPLTLTLSQGEREQTDACGERLGVMHLAPRYGVCIEDQPTCPSLQHSSQSSGVSSSSASISTGSLALADS